MARPSPRVWTRNEYGAVTDGMFEVYKEPPEHLRDRGIPFWSPFVLYDLRSGRTVAMGHFTTLARAKHAAHINAPIRQPKETP